MTSHPLIVTRAGIAAYERLYEFAGIGDDCVKNGIWEIKDGEIREQPRSPA